MFVYWIGSVVFLLFLGRLVAQQHNNRKQLKDVSCIGKLVKIEYFKSIKNPMQPRHGILLALLTLLFSCSPLKRYTNEKYGWGVPEIEQFIGLNAQEQPKIAFLFVVSSSIRLWETLARDMAPYPLFNVAMEGHICVMLFFSQMRC